MSIFSGLKKAGNVIEGMNRAAEDISKTTVKNYGEPVYSLYTALQFSDLHRRIDVMDEEGHVKYYTKSSLVTIKGKTDLMDADGKVIANLEKRLISLHEKHFITMADGKKFTLSNELLHVVKDITNIEGLGWQLQGNILGLSFNLLDEKGQPVAAVEKKMVSIHNKYQIGIYQPEQEQIVVAIVIQLEKMLEARSEDDD